MINYKQVFLRRPLYEAVHIGVNKSIEPHFKCTLKPLYVFVNAYGVLLLALCMYIVLYFKLV